VNHHEAWCNKPGREEKWCEKKRDKIQTESVKGKERERCSKAEEYF
jgi:hypothetical protein